MTKAWQSPLAAGPKMVLLALCDNANDQGECYPAVSTIAHKCSMGERTVQGHITDMEDAGILRREFRRGRSTVYHLYGARFDTPAESAPPQNPHPPPADSAPPPPQNLQKTPADLAPRITKEPSKEPSGKRQPARGTRLPNDWALPRGWGMWAMEKRDGWTEEHVREVAEAFRDHWVAVSGQKGVKLDWEATWRNWCRNARGPEQTRVARGGPPWWSTDVLILAEGAKMGMEPHLGEFMPAFKARVQAAIDNGGTPPAQRPSSVGRAAAPEQAGPARNHAALALAKALVGKSGPDPRNTPSTTETDDIE